MSRGASRTGTYSRFWAGARTSFVVFFLLSLVFAGSLRASVEITSVELTVSNLHRAIRFYSNVLQFRVVSENRAPNQATARLQLGKESLILREGAGKGRPIPNDIKANDQSFQHLAIVVGDMDAAYGQLIQHGVRLVSKGPQRLPDWNWDAARIRALYFCDPDGHFLELIQFPPDKGEPRWQEHGVFLGIDHTAIVVKDMELSRQFYRDTLGLSIAGESFNFGGEQELLNGVPGSRIRITSLRAAKGPGVELLEYEAPGTTHALAGNPAPADASFWQIDLTRNGQKAVESKRDPDGHALQWQPRPPDAVWSEYPFEALRLHWSRYLMEGAELGIFMIVALWLALALEHPKSPLHTAIGSPLARRFLFGLGIGITVTLLIYSTWGRQSGAQFNPAVTLSFLYLHRIQPWDAFFYIIAQFAGGLLGVILAAAPFWKLSRHKKVKFVVTEPGPRGLAVAFAAEFIISFILMLTLRLVSQQDLLKPLIGYFAGFLLLVYITFEVPFSGMSLNPARSVASAIPAGNWKAMWIYFAAPILAMVLAAQLAQ